MKIGYFEHWSRPHWNFTDFIKEEGYDIEKIDFDQIEKVYISGGFSAKINIDNAVKVGLLPNELKEKCVAINNSSLLGTVKFACENNAVNTYIDKAEYIDLSTNPMFSELFIENMKFVDES